MDSLMYDYLVVYVGVAQRYRHIQMAKYLQLLVRSRGYYQASWMSKYHTHSYF